MPGAQQRSPATELPDWVKGLPAWVRPDEVRWLTRRPWIAGFIRAEDYSLEPAIARFARSQRQLSAQLPASPAGGELLFARGYETTALRFNPGAAGVIRSVSITSETVGRINGIAVPYDQPSAVVAVSGILAVEQFDRQSFDYLPTSCPLIEAHDYERPPLGRVTELRQTTGGVVIEARIDRDHASWLRRWLRGEYSSLSIAFAGAPVFDRWTERDGYPLRTVRGARLVDVAVVRDPAYVGARITKVTP
ncbi:HK97 family phage prohead protease [Mycolicibacterium sphagni]|uniref:Prohead serine protease domain-containing protein n=1 Tax=Mycolicibacterium sphagni TaxID=1786 RepID=A0ABX2JPE4_9MYCO|nr:HK97 family phage prohead protease [Mycolicibacterium sphagni]NTY58672.1 hypothetical protein [Mycolicibacterium sphagni]